MRKFIQLICTLLFLMSVSISSFAADPIRFGVPPWPGVTVKTEVVAQILEAMGYPTRQLEIGPPVIYKSFGTGDIDVFMAAWMPNQREMFNPVKEAGELEVVAVNLDEAETGVAVPPYVYEAGVKSIADLDKHADKFDNTILTIETGAGMTTSTREMIANDVAGLSEWEMISATTPVMLSVAQDKIRQNEWVVFHAWKPHWMVIEIDMRFLEGVPGSDKLTTESVVYTAVDNGFKQEYPEPYKFFERFKVSSMIQSEWIYEFGFKERDPEDVAREWIAANMETVSEWLDGVRTASGESAIQAVQAEYE